MTIKEAIDQAINTHDARLAGVVSDALRVRFGYSYAQTFAFVQQLRPDVSLPMWESLMYEADAEG